MDLDADKLDRARDLGADETVLADAETDVPTTIQARLGGADVSIDALGIAETCRNSIDCLRPRGQHVQLGLTTDAERGEVSLPTDAMTMREITFLGSRGMPPSRYDELLRMLERDTLSPGKLVTNTVSLAEVPDRLAAMNDFETSGIEVVEFSALS
nr:zinc-binding dehydrogenase [Haladaptatus sp. W1]